MVVQQIEAGMSRQPCKVYIGNPCFGNDPNPRLSSIKCQLDNCGDEPAKYS